MDRDTCEHFTPAGLPCAECEIEARDAEIERLTARVLELVIELRIAPEVNPYRGELTDSSEVEWFEDHLLADDLILHSNLIGSEVGTVRKIKRLRAESAENERLRTQVDVLQAKVDALMLEFCPDEMSEAQLENWARHQQPARRDGR